MMAISLFHLWEYTYVTMFHPEELTYHSFLLDHSKEFTIGIVSGWVEYFVEGYFFPSMKGIRIFVYLGFLVVVVGQLIRTLAMITAGSNFHHLVRDEKGTNQTLVTFGIYHYLRHPAYFGWYWWVIATQVVLCNPLMTVAYAIVAWRFFDERIKDEEETMVEFFGNDYQRYRAMTPVGIPRIN